MTKMSLGAHSFIITMIGQHLYQLSLSRVTEIEKTFQSVFTCILTFESTYKMLDVKWKLFLYHQSLWMDRNLFNRDSNTCTLAPVKHMLRVWVKLLSKITFHYYKVVSENPKGRKGQSEWEHPANSNHYLTQWNALWLWLYFYWL